MRTEVISPLAFNGKLVFVDSFGKNATGDYQRGLIAQLGSTVPELRRVIAPKNFDLFISRKGHDYIGVNANKTYRGVVRGDVDFRSVHKSMLNSIVEIAKSSVSDYEKFAQK